MSFIPITLEEYLKIHLKSNPDENGRRHIDEMDPRKIAGFFDDEGYQISRDKIKMPLLCLSCIKHYEPGPEDDILCNLNRIDQKDKDDFICHTYKKI